MKPNHLSHLIPSHVDEYYRDLLSRAHVGDQISSALYGMIEATMEQALERKEVISWLEAAGATVIDWNDKESELEQHDKIFAIGYAVGRTGLNCYWFDAAPELQAFWVGQTPQDIAQRLAGAFFGLSA